MTVPHDPRVEWLPPLNILHQHHEPPGSSEYVACGHCGCPPATLQKNKNIIFPNSPKLVIYVVDLLMKKSL